jgi:hypothetical protein
MNTGQIRDFGGAVARKFMNLADLWIRPHTALTATFLQGKYINISSPKPFSIVLLY